MFIDTLEKDTKKVEMPHLFQDLNVLLAQLVGWQNIEVKNEDVLVSQEGVSAQKFDFLDTNVIYPIARKYSKKANKINDLEWSCEYNTKANKKMMVVSHNEQTALAMALVLELTI